MPDFLFIILVALLVGAAVAAIALAPRFLFGRPRSISPDWATPSGYVAGLIVANDNLPMLTTDQLLVLDSMSGELGYTAAEIAVMTDLSPAYVNEIRRGFRTTGLASYGPLYDGDGAGVRGSGYLLTAEGVAAQAEHRRQLKAVAA